MITQYDFFKTKYGEELLIDLIRLEDLEKYIRSSPVQRLTYYDITIIAEGQGTFIIDNCERPIVAGSVFFSAPHQIREWRIDNIPKGYALIFEEEFLCTFFNDARFVKHLSCFHSDAPAHVLMLTPADLRTISNLLEDIKNEISVFKSTDTHVLRALLYQVLALLNRKFMSAYPSSGEKRMNRHVSSFVQLVSAHHHLHRSVEYYAGQLHITAGHLNSLVKDQLGVSAKKYILNQNILEAKRMLRYTDRSIDEIASALNYENTTYFIRTFSTHTHATPLQFRRQSNP
ncbi:AraC family transcriptional regulator [Fulvivirgaceae bacterium PWU4]|uniref:AraC family transcriptional regulator n=1 Tax=Chryseosolibacter histidini TaxID=2782349 RepID=A0AAP2GIT2_9BACT|nr:AraC family transcriptional regulator [Chryseosolibacter histidini]MBT1697314.1 AraC family transcriptional regulator [Chryseosolibacter histidini]